MWRGLPSWLRFLSFCRRDISLNYEGELEDEDDKAVYCYPTDANLIMSHTPFGNHVLILDIDDEHFYRESSSTGHGHLIINKELSFDDMVEVLEVLGKHGIIQEGFVEGTKRRGYASVRTPWAVKDREMDDWSFRMIEDGKEVSDISDLF